MEDLSDIVDYALCTIAPYNDSILLVSAGNLFVLTDDEITEEYLFYDDGAALNGKYTFLNILDLVFYYGAFVLAALGIILILVYVIFFYFSVLNKILFIMIPVVVAAFAVITLTITGRIENMYYDSAYEKLVAISELCAMNLDKDLVKEIDDLDDIGNGNVEKLNDQLIGILQNIDLWGEGIYVELSEFNPSKCNHIVFSYPSTEEIYLDTYFLEDLAKLEEDRVGDSNTYAAKTYQPGNTYVDAVTVMYDEDENPIALLDVYSYNDKIQENVENIKKNIIVIAVVTTLALILLLLLLANYITRSLRKTTLVVEDISKGNLEARVEKIPRDEVGTVAEGVNQMADRLQELFASKEKFSKEVIETLVGTIDAKDKYTNGHSLRVARYSWEIAQRLGKSQEEQDNIYYAGLLHDIGKIGVPDEIINKTSRLNDDEYSIIKTHPELGYELLKNLSEIKDIAVGAYGHHERYDGKGYPRGLKGDENPETARIISVADAYDAMTSNRSYRSAMTQEKVRSELEKGIGTQFDPEFAKIMLEIDEEIKDEIYKD